MDLDTLGHRGACGAGVLRGSCAQWRCVGDSEVPGLVKVRIQVRYYYIEVRWTRTAYPIMIHTAHGCAKEQFFGFFEFFDFF